MCFFNLCTLRGLVELKARQAGLVRSSPYSVTNDVYILQHLYGTLTESTRNSSGVLRPLCRFPIQTIYSVPGVPFTLVRSATVLYVLNIQDTA